MKKFKSVIPAIILVGGIWVSVRPSYAKPEYAKKEKKSCVYCHVAAGKPDLNEAGNYYKEHEHSLDGFKPSK